MRSLKEELTQGIVALRVEKGCRSNLEDNVPEALCARIYYAQLL
jgi:hypothetical protein